MANLPDIMRTFHPNDAKALKDLGGGKWQVKVLLTLDVPNPDYVDAATTPLVPPTLTLKQGWDPTPMDGSPSGEVGGMVWTLPLPADPTWNPTPLAAFTVVTDATTRNTFKNEVLAEVVKIAKATRLDWIAQNRINPTKRGALNLPSVPQSTGVNGTTG